MDAQGSMMRFILDEEDYGKLARSKLDNVNENFRWYEVERLGEGRASALKLTGCVFRKATRGKNKGDLCIMVPGTKRTAMVSFDEIKAFKEKQCNKAS